MGENQTQIDERFESYHVNRLVDRVYPTEFVVRTFLASYPNLKFPKIKPNQKTLDISCGDGRNTVFLRDQGLTVYGTEITTGMIDITARRLANLGYEVELKVGRNTKLPFSDRFFDYVLACHCCYYCDEGETFLDNLREYARVMKDGAYLVASVADKNSYIFLNSKELPDGSRIVVADPMGIRAGCRLQAFSSCTEVETDFSHFFTNFSFGHSNNDYFGINEQVFWVVCQKRSSNG